jgi:flagellin
VPQTINTNLVSLNAQRHLSTSQSQLATSMQRLSSGLRVNSAKDDAAGLAIAERMNTQVRGMNVAVRNANDGISMAQVGEGALSNVSNIFQRMRELAVQSANGTNTPDDRISLNQEFMQLAQEATRTLGGTQFNGQNILATTDTSVFQIGANNDANIDQITVGAFDWTGEAGLTALLGNTVITGTNGPAMQITDIASAVGVLSTLDTAIDVITSQRANFGALQNRFENVVSNLMTAAENQTAARSRIMDADYAAETAASRRPQVPARGGR